MDMRTVWKRLSMSDVYRLIKKYNLDFAEQDMLKRFCKGKSYTVIADETLYSVRGIKKIAKRIYDKIKNDL